VVITTHNPILVSLLRDRLDVTLYYVYRGDGGAYGGCGARQRQAGGGAYHLRGHPLHEAPRSASPMQTCIITECYGNKCVGKYLRNAVGGKVHHKPNFGRELILQDVVKEIKPRCNRLIVVIDFETGDARLGGKELPVDTDLRKGLGGARSKRTCRSRRGGLRPAYRGVRRMVRSQPRRQA
jgi:hypothetical protein